MGTVIKDEPKNAKTSIDLEEIIRQQNEYIIDLEMELMKYKQKWEFLAKEMKELEMQKILEKEYDS